MTSRDSLTLRFAGLPKPGKRRRTRAAEPLPTVEEAKRRLAAAAGRDRPWLHLTPEFESEMAHAEDVAGGHLVGPAVYRSPDAE